MEKYTFNEYVADALRTESALLPLEAAVEARGLSSRLFHAILGVATEVNEMYDAIESNEFIDRVNILEECGDAYWYLAIGVNELKIKGAEYQFVSYATIPEAISALRVHTAQMLDLCKKVLFYGKELNNKVISDLMINTFNSVYALVYVCEGEMSSVLETNINKLKARYPEKFGLSEAENRNLVLERTVLEKGLNNA